MISKTKSLLDKNSIEELAKKSFGDNTIVKSVSEFSEGFFNAVYCVEFFEEINGRKEIVLKTGVADDKYVLTYEKNIMHTEVELYKKLWETDIPVPKILTVDFSRKYVNFDYFFMEKLEGLTWEKAEESLTPENREQLHLELGRYTAKMHSITGDYFGYIKDDKKYQFNSWKGAFTSFMDDIIKDGIKGHVELPFDEILDTIKPYLHVLDEVTTPCLVDYDMWSKNIILKETNGVYKIEGIIDLERAFYGDPLAEFISTQTICGELKDAVMFRNGYSEIAGKFYEMNRNEQIRFNLYNIYMGLLIGVEIYRYDESDIPRFMEMSRRFINVHIEKLKELNI